MAARTSRWFLRNIFQDVPGGRRGRHARTYRDTVRSEMLYPSLRSSPWIRSPTVLRHHASNEIAQLGVGTRSSWFAGDLSPVGAIRPSVPRDHSGGFDDRQGGGPVGPHRTQCDPEGAIDDHESRTTSTACGDGELLSQGEVVQDQGLSREGQGPTAQKINLSVRSIAAGCAVGSAMASDAAESIL